MTVSITISNNDNNNNGSEESQGETPQPAEMLAGCVTPELQNLSPSLHWTLRGMHQGPALEQAPSRPACIGNNAVSKLDKIFKFQFPNVACCRCLLLLAWPMEELSVK